MLRMSNLSLFVHIKSAIKAAGPPWYCVSNHLLENENSNPLKQVKEGSNSISFSSIDRN